MNEVERKFNILYSKIKISDGQALSDFIRLRFENWGSDLVFGEEKITPENYCKIESENKMFSVAYISRDKKYYRCRYVSSTIAAVTLYIQFARFYTKKACINKDFENIIKQTLSNGNVKEAENIIIDEIGKDLICFERRIPDRVSIFVDGYKESEPFIFLNSAGGNLKIINFRSINMEAWIKMDCSEYSENLTDIIKAFQNIGWNIYDPDGKIEYLAIDNNDSYDWIFEKISESELFDFIRRKNDNCEKIGINFFHNFGKEGFTLLAANTSDILLSICIYRRTIKGRRTDIEWYNENIIKKLIFSGVEIRSYSIEEYDD